jgi:cytochrome d ubiquinol oxidase subunit I
MVLAIVLPYLANSTGWLLTEFGRQPWIVFGEMRIEEAISPNVGTGALWISLIGFTLIYGVLMVADLWLLWKFGSAGTQSDDAPDEAAQPTTDPQPAVSY